jgi:pimeloyl-ACP methyl ester carboxylesterase
MSCTTGAKTCQIKQMQLTKSAGTLCSVVNPSRQPHTNWHSHSSIRILITVKPLHVVLLASLVLAPAEQAQATDDKSAAWSATPSTVTVEETFSNGAVALSGTLYLPANARNLPAVIVFHSASSATRDLALYRHLKQMLPPLGIAVFVYDRRGSGKSGRTGAQGDYVALADDGIAARRMLAQDPRLDSKRIGFWGLSQGGWLSLLAASRSPETAFAISVSAPMTTPEVQMNFAVANILRINGYAQADIDAALSARRAVDDAARGQLDRATAQKSLDMASDKPWFHLIYLDRTVTDGYLESWAKEMWHDPLPILTSVKAPTLIIYGASDPWVPAKTSVEALQTSASQHPNITVAVVAGADHAMNLSTPLEAQVDPEKLSDEAPNSPEYFSLIASWLTAQGFAGVRGR